MELKVHWQYVGAYAQLQRELTCEPMCIYQQSCCSGSAACTELLELSGWHVESAESRLIKPTQWLMNYTVPLAQSMALPLWEARSTALLAGWLQDASRGMSHESGA